MAGKIDENFETTTITPWAEHYESKERLAEISSDIHVAPENCEPIPENYDDCGSSDDGGCRIQQITLEDRKLIRDAIERRPNTVQTRSAIQKESTVHEMQENLLKAQQKGKKNDSKNFKPMTPLTLLLSSRLVERESPSSLRSTPVN